MNEAPRCRRGSVFAHRLPGMGWSARLLCPPRPARAGAAGELRAGCGGSAPGAAGCPLGRTVLPPLPKFLDRSASGFPVKVGKPKSPKAS